MDMARFLVTAIEVEKRSVREVAREHGVSKSWLYELLARHRREGDSSLVARSKAFPRLAPIEVENHRVRQDVVDEGGTVTLRYLGKLRHLGVGRAHKGTRVLLFVAGADVRVVTLDGELLRTFTIDPTKDYQGQ
jgi:transposase-like protein